MIELVGKRVEPGHPKLEALLDRWLQLIGDPYWTSRDAPWWYNESASMSTLAAAAWLNKGRALLDYRASKIRSKMRWRGRADLWMDIGEEEYVGESKIYWPSLLRRRGHAKTARILSSASYDAKAHLRRDGTTRIGVLFVAPWTPELDDDALANQTSSFIDGSLKVLSRCLAIAWCFRTPWSEVPCSKGFGYPGVVLAINKV